MVFGVPGGKKYYKIMNKLFIILCPPYYLKLPPLSLAYLASALPNDKNLCDDEFCDLNIELYSIIKKISADNKLYSKIVSDWEKNNAEIKQSFFEKTFQITQCAEYIEKLIIKLKNENFTHLCFSVFESNLNFSMKLAEKVKCEIPEIKIIAGGPEITKRILLQNTCVLNNIFDITLPGEGEKSIVAIKESESMINFSFNQLPDIDSIAFPDFSIFELKKYKTKGALPLLASRGCVNRCVFCSEKNLYSNPRFRMHSPEYIIQMIKYLKNKFFISSFIFQDSLINGDIEKLKKLCALLISENLKINWEAQFHITRKMDAELFSLIKKSGCYNMFLGLESGSDEILKKMKKNFNTGDAEYFFQNCNINKLHFEISLIIGFPGETLNTIDQTKKFIEKNSKIIPKIAQINPYIYYEFSEVTQKEYMEYIDSCGINFENEIQDLLILVDSLKIKSTRAFINNL